MVSGVSLAGMGEERIFPRTWFRKLLQVLHTQLRVSPVGKYFSEGDVKRTDDGLSVAGGTQLENVKWSDDGPSVVGSTQRDMSYAEVVSK